ncbi:hypothetical protein SAMN05660350_04073 [Geodermatophilus obscurus]|uniref:Uncharacterized protein n=1 Tax=Geodermatophilus obscurus TaxID=1861 RepID=A0A1M7UVW1_9ACTN|nr:hypothetical protein [Geodermatophilus obscurus]SHN87065.1 hypothetical protein SAMN05660350_04073 [Geodermatophilus obscurus]
MANDRAPSPRSSRTTDDLTLGGLLDVLDRAEPLPARRGPRPRRAAVHRTSGASRPAAVRPVPVPAARPRPVPPAPAAPAWTAPAWTAPAAAPAPRPGLRARVRGLVRRLALWGAGPDGAHLAWGRPAATAPAPRPDGPVVLTELPNTPTIRPAAPSPAAALRPARYPWPAASARVPVVAPLARQVPAPRPVPAPRTAQGSSPPGAARASAPARARGDPRPPPARGQPSG